MPEYKYFKKEDLISQGYDPDQISDQDVKLFDQVFSKVEGSKRVITLRKVMIMIFGRRPLLYSHWRC